MKETGKQQQRWSHCIVFLLVQYFSVNFHKLPKATALLLINPRDE